MQRISIPRLIRVCETNMQWAELTFLYKNYNEFDNAALTMIEHSPEAFNDTEFRDVIVRVSNTDITTRPSSYVQEQSPEMLNQLLTTLSQKVDPVRVVQLFRKSGQLALSSRSSRPCRACCPLCFIIVVCVVVFLLLLVVLWR